MIYSAQPHHLSESRALLTPWAAVCLHCPCPAPALRLQSAPTSAERFSSIPPTSCSGSCSQQKRAAELGRGFLAVIAGQGDQREAHASPQLATGTIADPREIINPLSWEYGLRQMAQKTCCSNSQEGEFSFP